MSIRNQIEAGAKQEFRAFKTQAEMNIKTLNRSTAEKATGPLGFIERIYPVRIGAYVLAAGSYLYMRLVSGDSPEEIATRCNIISAHYDKRSNSSKLSST